MIQRSTYSTNIMSMDVKQLALYVQSKGKRANQRLREIEKHGLETSSSAYRYVKALEFDADKAIGLTGHGEVKFNITTKGLSQAELRHKASEIEGFLRAKSSTVTGIKKGIDTAYETFTANYPNAGYDYKTFRESLSHGIFENFLEMYGSQELLELHRKTEGLTLKEVETILHKAHFYKRSRKKIPDIATIDSEIEKWRATHKKVVTDDNPLDIDYIAEDDYV